MRVIGAATLLLMALLGSAYPRNVAGLRAVVQRVIFTAYMTWFRRSLEGLAALAACLVLATGNLAAQDAPSSRVFRDCPDCPEMVVVPAGRFLMGSTKEQNARELATVPPSDALATLLRVDDRHSAAKLMAYEHPQHPVTIPRAFAIGRFPVTRGEFAAFVRETGHETGPCWFWRRGRPRWPVTRAWSHPNFAQTDLDPVVCVTWEDARAYARWLNKKLGRSGPDGSGGPYRLPSEAEWEYAARARTQTARWWGDEVGVGHALCNGCDGGGPSPEGTTPVGGFPPNPFGLYDMLGNAAEATEDCWHASYAGAPTDGSAWVQGGNCRRRIERGDNWRGLAWVSRVITRSGQDIDSTSNGNGFRIAKTLQ